MKITNEMMIPMIVPDDGSIAKIVERKVSMQIIMDCVCEYYGVDPEYVKEKGRKGEKVHKRQVLQYLMHIYCGENLETIGKFTGGYDHATITYSHYTVLNEIRQINLDTGKEVEEIEDMIFKKVMRISNLDRVKNRVRYRSFKRGTVRRNMDKSMVSMYEIETAVVRVFNMNISHSMPQRVCRYMSLKYTNKSLSDIGNFFGGVDVRTVRSSSAIVAKKIKNNESYKKKVERAERLIERIIEA